MKGEVVMSILWQVGILFSICRAAQGIAELLPFAFPASVLAMLLVFLLLLGGIIRIRHIKDLANWFSQNMGFLFVPACVEVMDYFDLIAQNLIPILVIGVVTTFLAFGVTGWTVKALMRLQAGKGEKTHG